MQTSKSTLQANPAFMNPVLLLLSIVFSVVLLLQVEGCKKPGVPLSPNGKQVAGDASPAQWPATPPANICGNASLLTGPATAPAGSITVPAGDDSTIDFTQPDKTYWFAPGVHTLGKDSLSQIQPGNNSTFIGGPGAIIDGQNTNKYAFTQGSINVTIRYLTIQHFVAPLDEGVVNHDAGNKWTIEYNTIRENKGAGLMAGPNNVYRYNCIRDNVQYGVNSCCGTPTQEIENFTLDFNEITGNNTDDWENKIKGCGCSGGVKFWTNKNITVTNNWVHHNKSVGLWLDNNNRGFIIQNNYINNNDANGLVIEQGYDARVTANNFVENAVISGRETIGTDDYTPSSAIYVSESGSPSGYGLKTSPMIIDNNNFTNNWGGIVLYENPNRYCGSDANTSTGSGTIKINSLYDDSPCKVGTPNNLPGGRNKFDYRWSTENVIVENNDFSINKSLLGCEGTGNYCGINGIYSDYGTYPEFAAYVIPWRITFQQQNVFRNNHYHGDWHFVGFQVTKPDGHSRVTWKEWTDPAPPIPKTFNEDNRPTTFGQDQGSTYNQ